MITNEASDEVYRLHVWIRQIGPMIWRRLLVRSDSMIADLHRILQIAFGWSDMHLNRVHIHGQDYGVYHDGGISFSTDPNQARLCDFRFRKNKRFLYEYDFGDCWQHEVRVEARLALEVQRRYPCCIGGQRRSPPDDCGSPLAFLMHLDEIPWQVDHLFEEISYYLDINDLAEDIEELHEWLIWDRFDRRMVNRRFKQYATSDETFDEAVERTRR